MKVLVTGANGLLASNLVRELLHTGYEVRGMVRENSNLLPLKKAEIEFFKGEITNPADVKKACSGCEVVIHAAANTSQWPTDIKFYEAVNIQGTRNVIATVKKNNIGKFIHVSTANTFGYGTKLQPGTEKSEFAFQKLRSGYITSKYIAQQLVLDEYEKHDLPVVVVNPTFMIGPYDAKPSSGKIIKMGLRTKLQVFPPGGKNFIHVRDAAIGVCNAIKYGQPGECYLLANENLTYREFYRKLNLVARQHPRMVELPGFIIRSAGKAGSLVEKIIRKPVTLNQVNAKLLVIGNYYSGKRAVEQLKMPQTPVDVAIREAMEWWNKN